MRYIAILILLSSCSVFNRTANSHLKIAERHLAKAKMKGAVVKSDTVFIELFTPETITDTIYVLNDVDNIFHDTITIETFKWKTKTRIDTLTKRIYQQVECKPDTIRVPVTVNTEVTPDKSKDWHKYLLGSLGGIVLIAAIFIFKR